MSLQHDKVIIQYGKNAYLPLPSSQVFKQKCSDKKNVRSGIQVPNKIQNHGLTLQSIGYHQLSTAVNGSTPLYFFFSTSIVLPRLSFQKQNTSVISSYVAVVIREKR